MAHRTRRPPSPNFSGTRFAQWYFAVQATALLAWWSYLWRVPSAVEAFLPASVPRTDLLAFALPDLGVAFPLSAVAATAAARGARWRVPLAWCCAGAMIYATGYTVLWAFLHDGGWLGVVLMVPAAVLCTVAAVDVSNGTVCLFRTARPRSRGQNLAATAGYIVLVWGLFLFVLPTAISYVEGRLGWPQWTFAGQEALGAVLFAACSALGLWSGVTMACRGKGTPLPMDGTNALVATGPYAHVRNPMAVAGLGQAFGVAVWLGSPLVVAYIAMGGAMWHFLVRPAEEEDLRTRFGAVYEAYRASVPLWVPVRSRKGRPDDS